MNWTARPDRSLKAAITQHDPPPVRAGGAGARSSLPAASRSRPPGSVSAPPGGGSGLKTHTEESLTIGQPAGQVRAAPAVIVMAVPFGWRTSGETAPVLCSEWRDLEVPWGR